MSGPRRIVFSSGIPVQVLFGWVREVIYLKFRFRVNKRTNTFITIFASLAIVAMLIVRFEYPVAEVWKIIAVSLFFLAVIVALAAAIGFAVRWVSDRRHR